MNRYDYIKSMAMALQADSTIRDYCIDTYGKGALIQIDDNPANPLNNEATPWILFEAAPSVEQGPIADFDLFDFFCGVGITSPTGTDATLPVVTNKRSATINGLQQVGNSDYAETLLVMVLDFIKEHPQSDGAMIQNSILESAGGSYLPMQVSAAKVTITSPNTF